MKAWADWVRLSVFGVTVAFASVHAQTRHQTGTIDADGVEMRIGQNWKFSNVGQLKKGDQVIIVREEDTGFYAIKPPKGSVSFIKQIHLSKVEFGENTKVNVPVVVEGADVMPGESMEAGPKNRSTINLPKGTIVEVVGKSVRIDNTTWYPITPPEGDLRWIPKTTIKQTSLVALPDPKPYVRPETPGFTISPGDEIKTPTASEIVKPDPSLPKVLTNHQLWAKAEAAERNRDYSTAKSLYASIYNDVWEQKAEREAIVICYNRYQRNDDAMKRGGTPPSDIKSVPGTTVSRTKEPEDDGKRTLAQGRWTKNGRLVLMQKMVVDGAQLYSFEDERGEVINYVVGAPGISLKAYDGKKVALYGATVESKNFHKPLLEVQQVEPAR